MRGETGKLSSRRRSHRPLSTVFCPPTSPRLPALSFQLSALIRPCTVFCLLSFSLPAAAQQDFKWSWEDGKTPAATGVVSRTTAADAKSKDFRWSWEKDEPGSGLQAPATASPVSPPTAPASARTPVTRPEPVRPAISPLPTRTPASGIAASAYNELLEDNLALRRKVDAAELAKQNVERDKELLRRDIADLEQRLTQSVARIKALQEQRPAAPPNADLDRVVQLEADLAAARRESAVLRQQLEAARQELAQTGAAAARSAADQGPGVAPGADLLRDLERENRLLKDKLIEIETARQRLLKDGQRSEQQQADAERQRERLEGQLAEARAETRRYQRAARTLQKEIPRLKEQLAREQKQERTRLDPSRKLTATSKEQRDMHYNMGVLLQQEGRFKEAEKEYLRAMRIDPSDPEVHYNLGVLYDDSLENDSRAAVHYRVYLRLQPSAEDSAQVREWLAAIEGE